MPISASFAYNAESSSAYLIWTSLSSQNPEAHASPVFYVSLNKRRER